jgi:POT family proton-dependent oligopeptide transporter
MSQAKSLEAPGLGHKYRTAPVPSKKMPKGIPYIIGNEAAERFSFYGMKGILVIFMTSYLIYLPGATGIEPMPEAMAIKNYHLFTTAVYLTPILGALIADILLGKYLTIISLSIVYCAGHGVLALMGINEGINPGLMLFLGLGLISIGSGGIKPCVSAHVGDQFGATNGHLVSKVFAWFYFAINTGAFISTMLTPWFLEWYGPHLAFGIPGVLMVFATIMFWMGRNVFIHVPPGGMKWVRETFSRRGISAILKLSVIYIFVAVFWALFDQTGSKWVLQAQDLDRNWLGVEWLSSQIQAVNPIMILILIPVFTFVIYPAINRVFTLTPIRKISIGLFIMVVGFSMVAFLQESIDAGLRPSIGWQIAAYAILTASEVMVSITCLEFSYTQAPRRMKSVIMAVFLMSVSLGNVFTAVVNKVILVESNAASAKTLASSFGADHQNGEGADRDRQADATKGGTLYETLPDGGFALSLAGIDGVLGSEDDIKLGFADEGAMTGFVNDESAAIKEGIGRVGAYWEEHHRLPSTPQGNDMVGSLTDPWGQPLRFLLKNGRSFIIASEGPDRIWQSEYDIRAEVDVSSLTVKEQADEDARDAAGDWSGWAHPDQTWLERRKAELSAERSDASGNSDESSQAGVFSTDIRWDVGGATTMTGASYFWFFTWLMLGTAVLFVPVGCLYRPMTYLQEEAE